MPAQLASTVAPFASQAKFPEGSGVPGHQGRDGVQIPKRSVGNMQERGLRAFKQPQGGGPRFCYLMVHQPTSPWERRPNRLQQVKGGQATAWLPWSAALIGCGGYIMSMPIASRASWLLTHLAEQIPTPYQYGWRGRWVDVPGSSLLPDGPVKNGARTQSSRECQAGGAMDCESPMGSRKTAPCFLFDTTPTLRECGSPARFSHLWASLFDRCHIRSLCGRGVDKGTAYQKAIAEHALFPVPSWGDPRPLAIQPVFCRYQDNSKVEGNPFPATSASGPNDAVHGCPGGNFAC